MSHRNIVSVALTLVATQCTFAKSGDPRSLAHRLKGDWALTAVTCKGVPQKLENDYVIQFNGKEGAYVSKTKGCTQIEPELYTYPSETTVAIKAGVRKCDPNPCAADLPATECGKETNPFSVPFDVKIEDKGNRLTLSTSDSKSVDCISPGQEKPAVFTFQKKGK